VEQGGTGSLFHFVVDRDYEFAKWNSGTAIPESKGLPLLSGRFLHTTFTFVFCCSTVPF
jgi:hypothetical protein